MADTGTKIPLSQGASDPIINSNRKTKGGSTVETQAVSTDWDAMDLGGATPNLFENTSTPAVSSAVDCEGLSKIIIKTELSTDGTTAEIVILLYDFNATANALPLSTEAIASTTLTTGVQSLAKLGTTVIDNVYGADEFKVQLVSITSGNISIWGIAV